MMQVFSDFLNHLSLVDHLEVVSVKSCKRHAAVDVGQDIKSGSSIFSGFQGAAKE